MQLGRPNIMTPFMRESLRDANIGTLGNKVIPEMKCRGFRDALVEKFFTDNPAILFA